MVTVIKLKEILRLEFESQLSKRQIAQCVSLFVGAISKYLQRVQAAGLGWPPPEGMIRQLLLEEYDTSNPGNHYKYSRNTVLFKRWRRKQQLSMRQLHLAREKWFIDYCGPTLLAG